MFVHESHIHRQSRARTIFKIDDLLSDLNAYKLLNFNPYNDMYLVRFLEHFLLSFK